MRSIFHTHIGSCGELFTPEPREAEHLFRVIRARPGEKVLVMDGAGGRGEAEVVDKKQLRFLERLPEIRQEIELDLYCAIPKKAKLDSLLPQLPGLGVRSLHPLLLEHSVATGENPARWELLLREGCKQSGNPRLPQIFPPVSLDEALAEVQRSGAALYYGSVTPADPGKEAPGALRAWFVGPEGGFTAAEEEKILAAGGRPLKLGSWIMRLESAAVAGLAVLSRALPLLMVLTLLLFSGCGRKDDVSRHPLMVRAERCRLEGEPALALRLYKRLLQQRPDAPQVRLRIATLCDETLNDPLEAVYHYNAYLKAVPESQERSTVEGYRQMAMAKLLRELKRASLPTPPGDTLQEQQKQIQKLQSENKRLNTLLVDMQRRLGEMQRYAGALKNYYEKNSNSPRSEELYTVRSGDTLSGIASAHGVPLRSLMLANGLTGTSLLRAGQVLKIPRI